MRELIPQLETLQTDVLLIDVQSPLGISLLDRFAFRTTPTYILYDARAIEQWRSSSTPTFTELQTRIQALSNLYNLTPNEL